MLVFTGHAVHLLSVFYYLKGKIILNAKIINLHRWEVYKFPWGTAVKEQRTGKWFKIFLGPDGQQIDIENISVILHENGIEFVK